MWDFELPQQHTLKTYFGEIKDISSAHGISNKSLDYPIIFKRYQKALYDHDISPTFQVYPQSINKTTGEVKFTADYSIQLRKFVTEFKPQMFKVPSFYTSSPTQLPGYLDSYERFIMANPWAGNAFIYFDEPQTLDAYKMICQYGQAMKRSSPLI